MKTKTMYGLFFLFLVSCQSVTKNTESRLRFVSMMPETSLTLSVQGKTKTETGSDRVFNLRYGEPLGYQTLKPGRYTLTCKLKGKTLLESTFIMGKNGFYTLVIAGLKPASIVKNPKTTFFELEYIFAGSEAHGANGYLPQWFMLRDNYDGSKEDAYVRVLNTSSMFNALGVKKDQKKFGSVHYPNPSEMVKLAPGSRTFTFHYGEIRVGEKTVPAQPGYIYTLITGDPARSGEHLKILTLKNPSRTLLKSEE